MTNEFNQSLRKMSEKHEHEIKELQESFKNTENAMNSYMKAEISN